MTDYKYILQPYRPGSKGTCPECERKNCFTYYINKETGERLSDKCGICDHKNSCGYHYPPKAYFHDHPAANDDLQRKEQQRPAKIATIESECHADSSSFMPSATDECPF